MSNLGVYGIVLAAGAARRFGRPKQLERWPGNTGPTLVERAAGLAAGSGLEGVIVVTGNRAGEVAALFSRSEGYPVQVRPVFNPRWEEGQGLSVAAGVREIPPDCRGALFFLADQPRLKPETVAALLEAFENQGQAGEKTILFPTFEGRRGNPVLFGSSFFPLLLKLEGDAGGRTVVKNFPEAVREAAVDDPAVLEDVDTPEELARIQ